MNKQSIFITSLSINAIALIGAGYLLITGEMKDGWNTGNHRSRLDTELESAPGNVRPGRQDRGESADFAGFRWQMIESEDYGSFIANLRAIGCPEETIKDIIVADVNKLFASRFAAVRSRNKRSYWETGRGLARYAAEFDEESRKLLGELEAEKRKMLKDLLGIDIEVENRALSGQPAEDRYGLAGFLPKEKQDAARTVLEQYETKRREAGQRMVQAVAGRNAELGNVVAGITSMLGEGRRNPLELLMSGGSAMWDRGMENERRAELAKILTPEELFEFELRNSSTAERMRWELSGFGPNESEFREVFRVRQETDQKLQNLPPDQQAAARAEREQQIETVMGTARFAEYKNSRNPAWSAAAQVATAQGKPRSTANDVLAIKTDAESEAAAIRNDAKLSDEQRLASLQSLSKDAEAQIAKTLGDDGLEQYKRNGGGPWLRMLERPQNSRRIGAPAAR